MSLQDRIQREKFSHDENDVLEIVLIKKQIYLFIITLL